MNTTEIIAAISTVLGVPAISLGVANFFFKKAEAKPTLDAARRDADIKLSEQLRDELRRENEKLKTAAEHDEARMVLLEAQKEELRTAHSLLAAQINGLLDKVQKLTMERDALKERVQTMEADASRHGDELEAMTRTDEFLREQNALLQSSYDNVAQENKRLREDLQAYMLIEEREARTKSRAR